MPIVRFKGNKLGPDQIKALVAGTLVNGTRPSDWWKKQGSDFRNTFMGSVRQSMQNGESLQQAITRVTGGTIDGVTVPGIMKTTRAKAGALTSTAMSAVTNEAALESYRANSDVIKAVTQLSTLDNRTSDICIAYSGQTWRLDTLEPIQGSSLPFNGGPPRHFNCRSRLRPVTKSFRELGLDIDEIPPGTRASMDGQVPADITFDAWLKGKPKSFADDLLGPRRAQLWRDDKITLTQLVDMRGNPMTLKQIEQSLGLKPKASFNPATGRMKGLPKPKPIKKPDPKKLQAQLADEQAKAEAAKEAAKKANTQAFNNNVAARIKTADVDFFEDFVEKANVPDSVKASALQRMEAAKKAAEKKAKKFIEKHKVGDAISKDDFNNRVSNGLIDDLDDDSLARKLFIREARKIQDAKRPVWDLDKAQKLMDEQDFIGAKTVLQSGEKTAEKTALLKTIEKGQKQADDIIERLGKGFNSDEVTDLDSWTALVKEVINKDDVPQWVRNSVLNNSTFKILEQKALWKPSFKQLDDFLAAGKIDEAKDMMDNVIPKSAPGRTMAHARIEEAIKKQKQIEDELKVVWEKNATEELLKKGVGNDVIDALEDDIKFMADMKKGVWDDVSRINVQQKALEYIDARDVAIAQIKSLNKSSKGFKAIVDFTDTLPPNVRQNPLLNKELQKQLDNAVKKANAAKQDVRKQLLLEMEVDEYDAFESVITEALQDVHKKLGKKQMQAKLAEIRAKVNVAKGNNPTITPYVKDPTNYAEEMKLIFTRNEIDELDKVAAMFKANGNDQSARYKLFDLLQGKTADQKRKVKEYVHRIANPAKLPNGKDFDEFVAEIVNLHKNNAKRSDIMARIKTGTLGLDEGQMTNFQQTIFTRIGDEAVNTLDDLGTVVPGELSPAAQRIFDQKTREGWPGEVPIPNLTAEEVRQGAKEWAGLSKNWARKNDSVMARAPTVFDNADRKYGTDSFGISKADWQKHFNTAGNKFTSYEGELIYRYTGSLYGDLNGPLWRGSTDPKLMRGAVAMNRALDKMPKHQGVLYRGENFRSGPGGGIDYAEAFYKPGETITTRGFWSTATKKEASFAKPGSGKDVVIHIQSKKKNGSIIGPISRFEETEMEVLYKAGSKFKVLKAEKRGTGYNQSLHVWLEEV